MSNLITPVTLFDTSFSGVLASTAVGKGIISTETWQQTIYPNDAVVTRIYYDTVEVYDNRAMITKHNVPNQIDVMI
jgi:hypothetical protein